MRPGAGIRPTAATNDLYNILYSADAAALDAGFSTLTGQVHAEIGTTAVRAIDRFADTLADRQMGVATDRLSARGTSYGTGPAWMAGEGVATDLAFLGAAFASAGAEIGDDAILGRLGLTAVASDRFSLGASYQAEIRDNLTGHTFSAEAIFRF
jgi:hypothetical protein